MKLQGGFPALGVALALLGAATASLFPANAVEATHRAPPTPPPIQVRELPPASAVIAPQKKSSIPPGLTLYSIGNPTAEEQLYLELINRARADPSAEAERLRATMDAEVVNDYEHFKVDLNLMVTQFGSLTPAPPLSMNAALTAAARLHSQDMLASQFQGHTSTDGRTTGQRVTAQGYDWSAFGENVYASAESAWHGHAAFEVDWGDEAATGGMQSPPGHRQTIHSALFREVGIGLSKGANGKVGPQLVTQDFGSRRNLTPFVTGVVYYDLNGNGFYDVGEGIEGATVLVASSTFYAVSAPSGGYSVPVPREGTYTVTFSLSGLAETRKAVLVSGNNNLKLDYAPPYFPPVLSGRDRPAAGQNNTYQLTQVPGAKNYQWRHQRRAPMTEAEGAENALARIEAKTTPGYEVIDAAVKASGSYSFHLAQPKVEAQTLTLNRLFKIVAASQLQFSSRLGAAGTGQTAKAQISADRGETWQTVWSQVGTETEGELAFTRQSIPLNSFADREVMVRFKYDVQTGTFFFQNDAGVGFYVDDILVTDADELFEEVIADILSGASLNFAPASVGDYSLSVRAKVSDQFLPWGPSKPVTAVLGEAPKPTPRITRIEKSASGQLHLDFEAIETNAETFDIESALAVTGPWSLENSASIQPEAAPARFRATVLPGASSPRFYRVRVR